MMNDRSGQQLGNYRLVQLLGRGGFANVYLANHIYLESHAAIKILGTRLDDAEIERFLTEAQTLIKLDHPHIMRILDFGIEAGTPYLIMEYASGGSLARLHPVGTPLPLERVVSYVNQIAGALQYAHDRRLIHRDVKPANMLVKRDGYILLSDFGIAVMAHNESSISLQGPAAGTPTYMAPEQIQGLATPASDQYALGVATYLWLCGKHPFHGGRAFEIISQHLTVAPPSLRTIIPSIPSAVERVVLKSLAKNPDERFATVQNFAEALEEACRSVNAAAAPASWMPVPVEKDSEFSSEQNADLSKTLDTATNIDPSLAATGATPTPSLAVPTEVTSISPPHPEQRVALRKGFVPYLTHILMIAARPFIGLAQYIRRGFQPSVQPISAVPPPPGAPAWLQSAYNPPTAPPYDQTVSSAPIAPTLPSRSSRGVPGTQAQRASPAAQARKNFFILYSKPDRSWAEWIAWTLEKADYTTILPDWDFRPGSSFDNEIRRATAQAERIIIVLSPDYFNARSGHARWATVFKHDLMSKEGILLPVLVRDCGQELKGPLESRVSIDLVERDMNTAREKLLAGACLARSKPASEPMFPPIMKVALDTSTGGVQDQTISATRQVNLDPALIQQIASQIEATIAKKDALPPDLDNSLVQRMKPEIESAFARKDWLDVIRKADHLIQKTPLNVPWDVYRMKGVALREEGSLPEARLALDTALALASDQQQRLMLLNECTVVLTRLNQWDETLRYIDEALRLAPNDLNWLMLQLHTRTQLEQSQNQSVAPNITKVMNEPDTIPAPDILDSDKTLLREPGKTIIVPPTEIVKQIDESKLTTLRNSALDHQRPDAVEVTRLMIPEQAKCIEVFFAYSHRDEELRDDIAIQLSLLSRLGLIESWYDREISAGSEWENEIDKHLNTAHIILLLVSAYFLHSEFCYSKEMKRALERHEAKETRVIPIILRATDWRGAPFGKLQALPKDGRPITSWNNRDEALYSIAQGIRKAVEELKVQA